MTRRSDRSKVYDAQVQSQGSPGARPDRKAEFIKELAKFLVCNQVGKSIALQIEREAAAKPCGAPKWAEEWAALRGISSLVGYPTEEEAIKQLTELLAR